MLNVIAVILLSRPLGIALRRLRPDMPTVVARDYGGTVVVFAVAAVLLTAGLVHRPAIQARQRDVNDAIARAQAWIGDRAPDEFRRNLAVRQPAGDRARERSTGRACRASTATGPTA